MEPEKRASIEAEVRKCLKELTKGEGVKRSSLRKVLSSSPVLVRLWDLELGELSDTELQGAVIKKIEPHIKALVPMTEKLPIRDKARQRAFRAAVSVGFNTLLSVELGKELESVLLVRRLEKLEEGLLFEKVWTRVDSGSSVRYINIAINQIVKRLVGEIEALDDQVEKEKFTPGRIDPQLRSAILGILSGVDSSTLNETTPESEPSPKPEPDSPTPDTPNVEPVPESVVNEKPPALTPETTPASKHPRRFVLGAATVIAAIAVLVAGIILWPKSSSVVSGGPLEVTMTGISDLGHGWGVVFPAGEPDAIKEYAARADDGSLKALLTGEAKTEDDAGRSKHFYAALDSGGYVAGGAQISLNLKNNGSEEVVVKNVRITPTEEVQPVPNGAIVYFQPGGDAAPKIVLHFDLDHFNPQGRQLVSSVVRDPFFQDSELEIKPKERDGVDVIVSAYAAAHSFRVAVEYAIGSQQYVVTVSRDSTPDGPPFRVSGTLCMQRGDLSREDRASLPSGEYDVIRLVGNFDSSIGTSDQYQKICRF